MCDSNSGFIDGRDLLAGYTSTFSNVEVIGLRDKHFFACASRYGRRWFLKGIRRDFSGSTVLRQQLLKEFEFLTRLSHPNVVSAVGVEEVEGLGLCIVMEWIEGATLEDVLVAGRLSRGERLDLLTSIVDTMDYVHAKGIVHRDLKPSNIMIRANGGKAVIVDFGLADTDEYTILKNPAGTEGYMSDRQQTARTPYTGDDVYGLGVIMQSLYPEYRGIIRRCTDGRETRRFTNAGELLRAIRRRGKRKKRMLRAVALLSAAVAITMITVLLIHSHEVNTAMNGLENQLDTMTLRAAQEQDQHRRLSDSLTQLGRQLETEREFNNRIREHDAFMQDAKQRLKNKLTQAYLHFLKTDRNPTYGDSEAAVRLIGAMASAKERVFASLAPLASSDRETLESAYSLYQGDILHQWTNTQKDEK